MRLDPFTISIGENACTCMSGTRFFTAAARSKYARAGKLGVDAPLHADLGGAELPRLLGAVGDLLQ